MRRVQSVRVGTNPENKLELKLISWIKFFFYFLGFLWSAHFYTLYLKIFSKPENYPDSIVRYFSLEHEANLPTYCSALLILIAAFILLIIGKMQPHGSRFHWQSLSAVMLFLSLDEATSIHETVGNFFGIIFSGKNAFVSNWPLPYSIFCIIVLVFYFPWLQKMPRKLRNGMLLSGFIYVAGALGIEILESKLKYIYDESQWDNVLNWTVTTQEIMEMAGMFLFVKTLAEYLHAYHSKFAIVLNFGSEKTDTVSKISFKKIKPL